MTRVASRATLGSRLTTRQLHHRATAADSSPRTRSALRMILMRGRLVSQHDGGPTDQGPGHHHPLALAHGDLGSAPAEKPLEPERRHQIVRVGDATLHIGGPRHRPRSGRGGRCSRPR